MLDHAAEWRPGSFTKNYAWGQPSEGLFRLHEAIVVGFDGKLEPVSREVFRSRIASLRRPDFIPMNFFLLNQEVSGNNFLLVDELVYQAITAHHSSNFDRLALTAFNISYVGSWRGAYRWQSYPSVWAYFFISKHAAQNLPWTERLFTADNIENFITSDARYTGDTSRKLATNLSYMYRVGNITSLAGDTLEQWWTSSVFLALDRATAEARYSQSDLDQNQLLSFLRGQSFLGLTGSSGSNRKLALGALCSLYAACGGMERWSATSVEQRQRIKLPHLNWFTDSMDPTYALYPDDPNLIKTIPQACAMLAKHLASFEEIEPQDFISFDVGEYVKRKTRDALSHLKALGVKGTMSAEDLLKLTRG